MLRAIAEPVTKNEFGSRALLQTIDDMSTALEGEFDGVAIAAPQIGVSLRIFIVSRKAFALDENAKPIPGKVQKGLDKNMVCINPEIIKTSRKKVKVPEGCLSVRWYYGNTKRHEKAMIRAYDEHGKIFTYGGAGLIAQIFQHEVDHLNGILFVDHATEIEELSEEEIVKIQEKNTEAHD